MTRRPSIVTVTAVICLCFGIAIGTCMLGTGRTKPYGPDAGFHPRNRTIGIRTKIPVPALDRAIAYWNDAAGRPLLGINDAGPVVIYDGDAVRGSQECPGGNCAAPVDSSGQVNYPFDYKYARCEIYLTDAGATNWVTVAHELGHCLGLNHDSRSIVGSGGPSSSYDRKMLEQIGYRPTYRRTPPPRPTPRPRRTPRPPRTPAPI